MPVFDVCANASPSAFAASRTRTATDSSRSTARSEGEASSTRRPSSSASTEAARARKSSSLSSRSGGEGETCSSPSDSLRDVALPLDLEQRLELGDGFEISRSSRGSIELHQTLERHDTDSCAKDLALDREREELLVGASADDLAEEIEVAQPRRQREIEPLPNRGEVPAKRKT